LLSTERGGEKQAWHRGGKGRWKNDLDCGRRRKTPQWNQHRGKKCKLVDVGIKKKKKRGPGDSPETEIVAACLRGKKKKETKRKKAVAERAREVHLTGMI